MTQAELITIGTELLLGEIQDTNTTYLARQLRLLGVDLLRTTVIGDNPVRIAAQIKQCFINADIVITTGGLGPTVDDPTREAAALACGTELEFQSDLWEVISTRFTSRGIIPTENNKKQAYLPAGAQVIVNPVGTAPSFWISIGEKTLICLPGVPGEMKTIFQQSVSPLLKQRHNLAEVILSRVLHVCCLGESVVDELIGEFEQFSNPTVGLCAHPGIVDIRITAKSSFITTANAMIDSIDEKISSLLSDVIYGKDETTLPIAINQVSLKNKIHSTIHLHGYQTAIAELQTQFEPDNISLTSLPSPFFPKDLPTLLPGELFFAFNLANNPSPSVLDLFHKKADNIHQEQRMYLGPGSQSETWAINTALGYVWKILNHS